MSQFQCPNCFRVFTRKQSLNYHLSSQTACKLACISENNQIKIFLKENQSVLPPHPPPPPVNLRKIPVKITKNSLKFTEKLENFENFSKKCEKKSKKENCCPFCHKCFTRSDNLSRHIESNCESRRELSILEESPENLSVSLSDLRELETKFNQRFHELKKENQRLEELAKEPRIQNNILQVVCVGPNDNYLDMLTDQCGFAQALEYIKGCALSDINGDIRLLQKIYFTDNNDNPPICFLDKKRSKACFRDENQKQIIDADGYLLSQRLGNNLQNTYLKGINHLITKNIENHKCPNKFLDEFDLMTWNQHIYDLSNVDRRRKIIKQLGQIT